MQVTELPLEFSVLCRHYVTHIDGCKTVSETWIARHRTKCIISVKCVYMTMNLDLAK